MDIREKAAAKLARCSRSEKELADYLKKQGFDSEEIEEVIDEFKEYGYLDDRRYAIEFVKYSMGKLWGNYRILQELKKKGVSQELGREALEELEDDESFISEMDRAVAVAEKMARASLPVEGEALKKLKGKISRRLSSYGFSSSVIYDALDCIRCEEEDFE